MHVSCSCFFATDVLVGVRTNLGIIEQPLNYKKGFFIILPPLPCVLLICVFLCIDGTQMLVSVVSSIPVVNKKKNINCICRWCERSQGLLHFVFVQGVLI